MIVVEFRITSKRIKDSIINRLIENKRAIKYNYCFKRQERRKKLRKKKKSRNRSGKQKV